MESLDIGNVDLCKLANAPGEVPRIQRHVINEVRVAAHCLLFTPFSVSYIVARVTQHIVAWRAQVRLIIRVGQSYGEFDVAAVVPTPYFLSLSLRLVTTDQESTLHLNSPNRTHSLVNAAAVQRPQHLVAFQLIHVGRIRVRLGLSIGSESTCEVMRKRLR